MLRYRFALKARIKRQKKEYTNIQANQNLLLFGVLTSFETLQKSHKQEKEALEAKISDLKSKQGVGITQDEISDLKANYEVS